MKVLLIYKNRDIREQSSYIPNNVYQLSQYFSACLWQYYNTNKLLCQNKIIYEPKLFVFTKKILTFSKLASKKEYRDNLWEKNSKTLSSSKNQCSRLAQSLPPEGEFEVGRFLSPLHFETVTLVSLRQRPESRHLRYIFHAELIVPLSGLRFCTQSLDITLALEGADALSHTKT